MAIKNQFPTSNISGNKNINSMLTVWKKTYHQVSAMQATSGFGFNDRTQMVTVEDDLWAEYILANKSNKEVENMRYKSFPYYRDWVIIFGTDRARGEKAKQLQDTALGKLQATLDENAALAKSKRNEPDEATQDLDSDTELVGDSATSKKKDKSTKKKGSKKHKSAAPPRSEPMVELLGGLFEKNNSAIESIAERIAARQDAQLVKTRETR